MRIGIAGPLGTPDIEHLLSGDKSQLPREMKGASLLVTLIEELLTRGHEVSAFTTDPALFPRRSNRVVAHGERLTVYYVPRRRHSLRMDRGARGRMLDLFALERHSLADAMRENRPDIIHAHWSYEFAAAALKTGLPCLVTCHDSPWAILKVQRDFYRVGRLLMARSVLSKTRHATVVSPYLVAALHRMTEAPLTVIPNPLPKFIFDKGRSRVLPDFSFRPPQIAMLINGWSELKNPETGMLAMKQVREAFPGATMHLYGPDFGPMERAWNWAKEQGLQEAFVFHGWTPYAQTMSELNDLDLLVHPALEESFGMTIAEAMALGIPVVAGKESGAIPWVLGMEDGGGALVDVKAPVSISDAVIQTLSNAEIYERHSANGRKRAMAYFSASAVTDAYIEQYLSILSSDASDQKKFPAGEIA